MNEKTSWIFLLLVLVQGMHSIEEYVGKLWETFPPARALCSLVSDNLVTGFLIGFWIALELVNGIGHPVWTIMQNAYTPGILTAPILLIISIILVRKLLNEADAQ